MYNGRAISGALSYAIEQVKYEPKVSVVLDILLAAIYFLQLNLRLYALGKQLQLPST